MNAIEFINDENEEAAATVTIKLDGEGGKATVNSYAAANEIMQLWASKESPRGGYCKTWFTITAANGAIYKGRIDLLKSFEVKSDILKNHMQMELDWMSNMSASDRKAWNITEQDVTNAEAAKKFWLA